MSGAGAHEMHLSIAEYGKVLALRGDHVEALNHYREAIRLAVSSRAPEVFFRHYTQCVLESLELTGSYEEIIEYCKRADEHYDGLDLHTTLHRRDHGAVLERMGLVQLKAGEADAGRRALERALELAGDQPLPLAREVLAWLGRGYRVDTARILTSQRRHDYFVVRPEQVNEKCARPLTATPISNMNPAPTGLAG